ncbi:MAG: hypothetical protein JSV68_02815 [Anaerolineaceae bacterium]|nr:MAG: hypothetical protein JSV68_02815 [Anaerolineaceae bacterium]
MASIPDAWIEELAIAGTPEDWAVAVERFVEAGANSVVLVPLSDRVPEELELFARHLLG